MDDKLEILFIGGQQDEIDAASSAIHAATGKKINATISLEPEEIKQLPRIDAVICHKEAGIKVLAELVGPLKEKFPNIKLPIANSLKVSTDKYLMRQAFAQSPENISAKFSLIDQRKLADEVKRLKRELPERLVIKPSHNASSMYVSLVRNAEPEIQRAVRAIQQGYQRNHADRNPQIVAEEFLDGPMYSIDAYVDSDGQCVFCPPVRVITGYDIGKKDFFGFCRLAPVTELSDKEQESLTKIVSEAIKQLDLINCSAHAELRLTKNGWRVIEIGPRIGGYRHLMYGDVYGFSHAGNDALNRLGLPVKVKNRPKMAVGILQIYPDSSGRLKEIVGLDELVRKNPEVAIIKRKQPGAISRIASDGGFEAATLYVKAKSLGRLLDLVEDIKSLEVSVQPIEPRK